MRWLRLLPNLLTLMRLLLTLPIAWQLLAGEHASALLLFALAGATDALDGFLARRFGWFSRFGAILDPLADKLLLVTSYICLTLSGLLPLWLTLVVLGRDLLILAGALLYRRLRGPASFPPSVLGKLSTVLQIVLVLALLLELSIQPAFVEVHALLQWLVLLLCLASGADYLRTWLRRLRATRA